MDTIGVSQTDFLSGEISMTFDLEKARAVCKTLPKYMNGACPCKEEAEAAKMLIKALPEIRRLQEFRDRVARILKQPLTDCDDLLILGLDARICQLRRQAAEIERLRASLDKSEQILAQQATRIEELGSDLEQSEICIRARLDVIDQQAARIKELETWLKKERATRLLEKSGSILLVYLKENDIDFDEFFDGKALEQLQAEGKLGNSDHSPDATKMVWQITEERIDVLGFCLSGEFNRCGCAECDRAVAVLRAMLTEGE